jgi:hypothetical protein
MQLAAQGSPWKPAFLNKARRINPRGLRWFRLEAMCLVVRCSWHRSSGLAGRALWPFSGAGVSCRVGRHAQGCSFLLLQRYRVHDLQARCGRRNLCQGCDAAVRGPSGALWNTHGQRGRLADELLDGVGVAFLVTVQAERSCVPATPPQLASVVEEQWRSLNRPGVLWAARRGTGPPC